MPGRVKEIFFFDRHFDRGVSWYEHYFAHCKPGKIVGEVSATYFSLPEAPGRVAAVCPQAKLVATLRNPIDRAWSMYQHRWRKGDTSAPLFEAVETFPEILSEGLYADQLRLWSDHFGPEALKVALYEDIVADPAAGLADIYGFVGADPDFRPRSLHQRINETETPRNRALAKLGVGVARWLHRVGLHEVVDAGKALGAKRLVFREGEPGGVTISNEDRERLGAYYADDVGATSQLLGRDLAAAWLNR